MFSLFSALVLAQAPALPITDVTVFSDRARVTRSGTLNVSGEKKLELAVLLDTVDTSTLDVEVTGAELETVELSRLEDEQLPQTEARALLTQLDENGDAQAKVGRELTAVQQQEQTLQALVPQTPVADPLKPAVKLSASGWAAAVGFASDQLTKVQARARELRVKQQELTDKRQVLVERAGVLGGAQRRTGTRVVANLKGSGPAHVALSYVALRARWYPTYDVQLVPDTGKVQIAFLGLVSQETGEDWSDALLTLSTSVPSQSTQFPALLTWKIGTKERFIPTPTPVSEAVRPAPAVPQLAQVSREEDLLRASLQQVSNDVARDAKQPAPRMQAAKPAKKTAEHAMREELNAPAYAAAAPPQPPASAPMSISADGVAMGGETIRATESQGFSARGERSRGPATRNVPFSLSPPPSYERPRFAADLPAMAAGGYDLSWPSLQRETVQTGKESRRVALFTQSWPVTTERKIYPALFSESFLTAELKNPAAWPLPAGTAHLFVGADPSGTAALKLVSPGETFTLPLGIDRALKPVRNVRVVDAEHGLISKDDVSEYTVTIALANPYRSSVAVRLYDQLPVTDNKDVEVTLLQTTPAATQDKVRGHLEWRLTVPAGQKTEVAFKYTLKRPKGWRMQQWEVAP